MVLSGTIWHRVLRMEVVHPLLSTRVMRFCVEALSNEADLAFTLSLPESCTFYCGSICSKHQQTSLSRKVADSFGLITMWRAQCSAQTCASHSFLSLKVASLTSATAPLHPCESSVEQFPGQKATPCGVNVGAVLDSSLSSNLMSSHPSLCLRESGVIRILCLTNSLVQ